jgi:hypothetical protein
VVDSLDSARMFPLVGATTVIGLGLLWDWKYRNKV